MKLTDAIYKKSEIQEGITQFFIADNDFSYNGLPILKDSLVYYNGDDKLQVNMTLLGIFQERNVPEYVLKNLPSHSDDDFLKIVERCSDCAFEIVELDTTWHGIWHHDHFDEWSGDFSVYLDRIEQMPSIEYSGITFSSLMYFFNPKTNSLSYFINTKPIKLSMNNQSIELPAFLEMSLSKSGSIIPLKDFNYFGISFGKTITLSENGVIIGRCENEFKAEIFGHDKHKQLIISKHQTVEVDSEGRIYIKAFSDKSNKIEKYEIRVIKNNQ